MGQSVKSIKSQSFNLKIKIHIFLGFFNLVIKNYLSIRVDKYGPRVAVMSA